MYVKLILKLKQRIWESEYLSKLRFYNLYIQKQSSVMPANVKMIIFLDHAEHDPSYFTLECPNFTV